jgi:diguanylate cyclase (GGDEF)-like protein
MSASVRSPDAAPGVPLGTLVLVLAAGSVLVAALSGYAVARWIGSAQPWIAAFGAGFGMAVTVLPLGLLLFGLARRAPTQPALPPAQEQIPADGAMAREPFMALAEREWARARRYGSGAALLLVEIDRFARLADGFGQGAGEAVLRAIVRDIGATLRGADALAHHGEGQIAVFLAQADATGALDVADRIRERAEALEAPSAPRPLRFTVSVGVAHLRPAHLNLQALLEDAADALYAARQAGGNCVRAAPVEVDRRAAPGSRRDDQRAPKS